MFFLYLHFVVFVEILLKMTNKKHMDENTNSLMGLIENYFFVTDGQTIYWNCYQNQEKVPKWSDYDQQQSPLHKYVLNKANTFVLQRLSLFLGT